MLYLSVAMLVSFKQNVTQKTPLQHIHYTLWHQRKHTL